MQEIILVKYGEMALKGMNKKTFEDVLVKNIKRRIKSLGKARITRAQSTIYVEPECENFDIDDEPEFVDRLKKIFGIYSFSIAYKVETKANEDFCDVRDCIKALALKTQE